MTPERYKKICQVLDRRQNDMTVVTDEVHKSRNLSAIIRSCDATGVDTVHCVMPRLGYQTHDGVSASAEKWVNVEHHSSVSEVLAPLKTQGYQIIAANLCAESVDYRELDYTRATVLLLGAEREGVSAQAQDYVDHNVLIPMMGMVDSLNVSVACAIILMEARAQREAAGMFHHRSLPEALYKQRFFRWAHPKLAEYCDKNALDYPEVDSEGEVIDLPEWYAKVRVSK